MLNKLIALQAKYVRSIDDGPLEEWPSFFLEACLYKITTADNFRQNLGAGLIYADSRAMLVDRVSALRHANIFERHVYRHIVGLPHLLSEGDAETASDTPFTVIRTMRDGATDIFATGRYLDRCRLDGDGSLKFAERIVVCDGPRIDTLLVLPL
jgi:anthranilate 1,2-dioxygenase small subunit